jgi:hypothetical protein
VGQAAFEGWRSIGATAHDFALARSNGEGVMPKGMKMWRNSYNQFDYNFPKIRFCGKGHALLGDNVVLEGRFPKRREIRCRICLSAKNKRVRATVLPTQNQMRSVFEALHAGKSVYQIVGKHPRYRVGGAIVHDTALRNFFLANVSAARRIKAMSARNVIAQREAAKQLHIITAPSIIRAADDIMNVICAAVDAVPRRLVKDHRDDVIQNIWLDILQGRLKRHEIAAHARRYVNDEYRTSHNKYGNRSLDVPIWIDGNTTLLDTLTRGMWD